MDSTLSSISEDSTDISCDERSHNMSLTECSKYIRSYVKSGFLKANSDTAKKCREKLRKAGKLSVVDDQRVTCQILRHHFNRKSDVDMQFFIGELLRVNVLEKDFFKFMRDLDSVDCEWRIQIFEALNEAVSSSSITETDLDLRISDNCHALLTLTDKHEQQLSKDLRQKLCDSTLRVLSAAFQNRQIFDINGQKILAILDLGRKAGVERSFNFLVVRAWSVLKYANRDIAQLTEAERLVARAAKMTEDQAVLSNLVDLSQKLRDERRVAEITVGPHPPASPISMRSPVSPSPSSRPCDSEDNSLHEPRLVKKVKKKKPKTKAFTKSGCEEDAEKDSGFEPAESLFQSSHASFPQASDFDINFTLTTEGKSSDEMDTVIDFMDSVSFLPTSYEDIHLSLVQAGLMAVQEEDLSAVDALWSVMQPLAHKEKKWHLANVSLEDFKHRLDLKIPTWRHSSKELFNGAAEEFRVRIQLQSAFQPLIPDVTVSPCSGAFATTLSLLHTGPALFRGLKQKTPTGFEFVRPREEEEAPAAAAGNQLSAKVEQMIRTASQLRRLQTKDDFSVSGEEDKQRKRHYRMLPEAKLKELLKEKPASYKRCILRLQGPHEGLAEPVVDADQPVDASIPEEGVILRGRTKCGMAFEGDQVVVNLHRDAKGAVVSGEVVGVWSSPVRPVNRIFFCRVSADQANLMRPICSTVPKIHVANEPGLNEYEQKEMPSAIDLLDFHQGQGSATARQEERAKKQYGNQEQVSIFREEIDKDTLRFRIDKVEKVQRHTCNDIFVVIYKRWQPTYLYPFGHVICRLPSNLSRADEVAVLRLQNNLPHPFGFDVAEEKAEAEAKRIASRPNSKASLRKREDFRTLPTVTIDNDDTVDMDDALSFQELENDRFDVGVHITDVAHFIPQNSDLDTAARRRALTVYAKDLPPVHMLPPELAAKHLSLVEGEDRLCLCVMLRFSKDKLLPFDKTSDLKRSVIRSDHRLTKSAVAAALDNRPSDVPQNIGSLLKRAHRCAQVMRSQRLKQQALTIQLNAEDWPKPPDTYKVEQLVEELMVECNSRIGRLLADHFGTALFRWQPGPEEASVEGWLQAHRDVARHSGSALRWLQLAGHEMTDLGSHAGPVLSADVKAQLEDAKKKEDVARAFQLLACEAMHPRQYVALRDVWTASKNASYTPEPLKHFTLNDSSYLHFTSPIRRYNDIVVQRLVHRALDGVEDPGISLTELEDIAETCNERSSQMRHYNRDLEVQQLNWQARAAPLSLACVITDLSSPRVLLDHPVVRRLGPAARSVTDAQLNVRHLSRREGELEGTWEERLFILDPQLRERHPNRRHPVSARRPPQLQALERQFRLGRFASTMPALPSLLRALAGNEGGRLLASFTFTDMSVQAERVPDVTSEVRRLDDVNPEGSRAIGSKERKFVLDPSVAFTAKLRRFDSLRVQFAPARGRERGPSLSLVRLAPSFAICLDHMTEPVLAFGHICGASIPRKFSDLDEYQRAWQPVLRMESIAESVDDENAFHLAGVRVCWFREKHRIVLGVFELPADFCSNPHRQIQVTAEGALATCDRPGELDYVCVRVELRDFCWVGHGGITFTAKSENRFVIAFRLNERSQALPREALEKLASVEVIKKTMPKRRQERAVELLKTVPMSTAAAIAVGDFAADPQCHPFLKTLTRQNFVSEGLFAARCNPDQKNAITNAFSYPISLIWGPPGTGKTMTGVQITFWFAQYNQRENDKPEATSCEARREAKPTSKDEEEEESGGELSDEEAEKKHRYKDIWGSWTTVGKRPRRSSGSRPVAQRPRSCPRPPSGRKQQSEEVLEVRFPSFKVEEAAAVPLRQRRRQVLYCGPSNACVNCVAEHIRTKVVPSFLSIVRVFSEQVEAKEFRIPGEDISCSRFDSDVEVPENLLEVSLHRLIRLPDRHYAKLLAEFDEGFRQVCGYLDGKSKFSHLHVVVSGAPFVNELSESSKPQLQRIMEAIRLAASSYHALLTAAKSEELRQHDVVLCTTAVSSNLILQNNCSFCQVIIDEAGMCTEPETLVPLVPASPLSASAAVENVVLIGDYKQLRPILKNNIAAELGLQHSMLERHWEASTGPNRVMLQRQYRMHPSLCEFPSRELYYGCLMTEVSPMWTGLERDDIDYYRRDIWNGLNMRFAARWYYPQVLENGNANVLHGSWPGLRMENYRCTIWGSVDEELGEEERIIFLHVEGQEENLTRKTEKGSENSKCNQQEIREVIRIYMEMRKRFSQPRNALGAIAVLSQYQHQVNEIRHQLTEKLSRAREQEAKGETAKKFLRRFDKFRRQAEPIVTSVVQSQGSEFDYVILSTVRSLPKHDINDSPTPGWEKKYLGFITDINQINVALTRARKGLIIIGNGELLKVHKFWKDLLENLDSRGCYVHNSRSFSPLHLERSPDFPRIVYERSGNHERNWENPRLGSYFPDEAFHSGNRGRNSDHGSYRGGFTRGQSNDRGSYRGASTRGQSNDRGFFRGGSTRGQSNDRGFYRGGSTRGQSNNRGSYRGGSTRGQSNDRGSYRGGFTGGQSNNRGSYRGQKVDPRGSDVPLQSADRGSVRRGSSAVPLASSR